MARRIIIEPHPPIIADKREIKDSPNLPIGELLLSAKRYMKLLA